MNIREEAQGYVYGLNRAPLGRFAVSERALIYGVALTRIEHHRKHGKASRFSLDSVEMLLTSEYQELPQECTDIELFGEVYYWTNEYVWLSSKLNENQFYAREKHVELLDLAAANDEATHDYLAVGVTHIPTIKRFISEGVDPELAARLTFA